MRVDLSSKTALVTGGNTGLGREIALTLARCNAKVIATYCNSEPIKDGRLIFKHLDITDLLSINTLADFLPYTTPSLDILVNNAGINHPGDLLKVSSYEVNEVIQTNLVGTFNLTQALYPRIKDNGSIVFISSSSAATGGPVSGHYAASKAGIEAMMRGITLYNVSRGIRANAIAPGYLDSPMADKAMGNPEVIKKINSIPMQRLGTFQEVANVAAFLVSDLASYITGQVIRVDGGLVL